MSYALRDYQTAAAAAILRALSERRDSRPVAVLPTGAGKSLVLAEVARAAVQDWHGRVLVLAHVKELLQQNAEKLRALLPASVAVGVHSAGLKRRDTDEPVVVAGVQSAVRRAGEFGKVNLAIVDEAHLLKPSEEEGMYRTLFDALRTANPGLRVAGFTATPFRLGHGLIYGGDGNIFTEKCYEIGVRELIERGFLSPLVSRTHDAGAKLSGLHMRGGEFVAEEAEAAMRAEGVTDSIAADAAEKARGRRAALVFAAGVAHARELAEALAKASGERAEVLTGETPPEERARLLAAFRGETARDLFGSELERPLKWLVNVGVLTTGFDAPNCDCVVLARATASTGLYVQMVGRGFRRSPKTGKENCVAEGTKILTDRGLVPVENITKEMKLWDGVEFVRHEGAVCKGIQNAIEYAGLVATPDHKVWTGSGWRTFGECAELGLPISCTGIEGTTIREADRCFRFGSRCAQARLKKPLAKVRSDEVRMRPARLEVSGQPYEGRCRLSVVRTTEARAEVACQQGDQCEGSLRKSKEQDVQEIRRSRHSFLFPWTNRDGCVDYGEFGELVRQNEADRPNRQQRKLRAWEPANGNRAAERVESSFSSDTRGDAVPATTPGSPIRGRDVVSLDWKRTDGRGDRREVSTAFVQTKRRVWDILNAGPRHRFTANGLLVSNCLVLDYGDNILRHGPVDAPEAFAGGGPNAGAVAWKRCPVCEAAVPSGALKCHACGHEWPARTSEIGAGLAGSASGRAIISGEDTEPVDEEETVTAEFWEVHAKRGAPPDAPRTVQITYYCGPGRRFREWLCPEHVGFARNRSEKVWAFRVQPWADKTMPTSAEDCVAAWDRQEVRPAQTVRLSRQAGEKYIRAEAVALIEPLPPPNPEPTAEHGDAWEPPATKDAVQADNAWLNDTDDLPF